jgi:hypothetical protein
MTQPLQGLLVHTQTADSVPASRSDTAAAIDDSEAGAYPPDIAIPVHNLAIRLTEVGRRQVALARSAARRRPIPVIPSCEVGLLD